MSNLANATDVHGEPILPKFTAELRATAHAMECEPSAAGALLHRLVAELARLGYEPAPDPEPDTWSKEPHSPPRTYPRIRSFDLEGVPHFALELGAGGSRMVTNEELASLGALIREFERPSLRNCDEGAPGGPTAQIVETLRHHADEIESGPAYAGTVLWALAQDLHSEGYRQEDSARDSALAGVYSDLVAVIDRMECHAGFDDESYASDTAPGDCHCDQCKLHRLSDRIWRLYGPERTT